MTEAQHNKRLQAIELDTEKLRRQIMQLEFQLKKDIVEANKQFKESNDQITKQIKYIAKLAGITYDELDKLDFKISEAGRQLSKPRERSTLA
jgi:hypothetical protein